ncbi:unnamed protein product [Danaus chrysippus]|uniref:S-adenosylmethionine sensor upstream of mTORC1 n=1 Tax=Danaus chrysippus TaxID=151541 RepID=A0A8J2QYV8_9NEOP|nr:unnamed protein product [Danaus chrysippus]
MASDEHIELAQYLKNVHTSLRNLSSNIGAEKAWIEHCNNKEVLNKYAQCMQKLATVHWDSNSKSENSGAFSRIKWATEFCEEYFTNSCSVYTRRDMEIAMKINVTLNKEQLFHKPYKLLDVGSCYNPFQIYDFLDVLAIDLCPANESVKQCDFLNVCLGNETIIINNEVTLLKENSFDVVTFCFLLEYMPTSEQRIKACLNAYKLLKFGGLLIINTPDSKHVGANSKIMKCWRYTLACLGFSRVKYEKFKHIHCMAFRKSLNKEIAVRWATIHKQPYMEFKIQIPQDFLKTQNDNNSEKITVDVEDFGELPFNDFEF